MFHINSVIDAVASDKPVDLLPLVVEDANMTNTAVCK